MHAVDMGSRQMPSSGLPRCDSQPALPCWQAVGEEAWKEVAKEQAGSSEPLWEQLEDLAELPPLPSYQHTSADAHITIGTASAAQPKHFHSSSGLQTAVELLPHLGNSLQRTFTEDMQVKLIRHSLPPLLLDACFWLTTSLV